jgi:RNA polymerase sigma factor (sigma-70 family)
LTPKSLIEPARHAGTALLRSQTDSRLVDLTRDGNERAFEAIVQRYSRPLLRYCSRLLPAARAEDAVQQALLSAHRAIHAGDAELNLRPWLYRIAHNASLNLLRQNGFDHDEVSEDIDGVETPVQAFERGERLRTVVAAVQGLPERQRSAIVLQAVEGRSYDEIAAELGVSDGAVRQLLNRARNTLREAAAAVTPAGLLTRVASSGGEATVAERVAQALAGAGGSALIAKAGATLVVAGAVAGGAAVGGLPGGAGSQHRPESAGVGGSGAAAVAEAPRAGVVLTRRVGSGQTSRGGGTVDNGVARGHGGGSGGRSAEDGGPRHHGGSRSGEEGGRSSFASDDRSGSDDHSGSDHFGSGDSGSGDRSGSDGGGSSGSSRSDDGSGSGGGLGSDSGSGGESTSGSGDDSLSSGSGSGSPGGGSDDTLGGTSGDSGTSGSGGSDDSSTTTSSGRDRSGSDDPLDGSGTSGRR